MMVWSLVVRLLSCTHCSNLALLSFDRFLPCFPLSYFLLFRSTSEPELLKRKSSAQLRKQLRGKILLVSSCFIHLFYFYVILSFISYFLVIYLLFYLFYCILLYFICFWLNL